MKTGILFDLDGTLLNTLEDLLDATNYALRQCGYSERTLGELRRFVGNGAENQIRMSLPEGASPEEVEEYVMNNGFSLMESILALLIVSICIQILIGCICSISNQEERILNEKIEKKWFYSD